MNKQVIGLLLRIIHQLVHQLFYLANSASMLSSPYIDGVPFYDLFPIYGYP